MRQWARACVVTGAVATAHVRRAIARSPHPATHEAPRIVLVRPDHIGDVLLSTPAIAALRAALPSAHLAALVGPWAADVLAANPHLDAVHTLPFPGFQREAPPAGWRAYPLLRCEAERVRACQFDAAVNLRPDFWWGAALLALADVPVRVGYDMPPGGRALTHTVPPAGPRQHAVRQAWRLARVTAQTFGGDLPIEDEIDPTTAPLVYRFGAADEQWAAEWLAERGIVPACPPFILHPGSGALVKLWPPRQWAHTLDMLADEFGAPMLVAGTSAEAALVQDIVSRMHCPRQAFAFTEDVSLGRYAALLVHARFVLGVDSGPLHLAAALGRPTVRLYGPTDPAVFGPWAPARSCATVVSDLPCAFCGRLDFPQRELAMHPCMKLLTPQAVVVAVRGLFSGETARGAQRTEATGNHARTESVA